jgi:hypothetical protein
MSKYSDMADDIEMVSTHTSIIYLGLSDRLGYHFLYFNCHLYMQLCFWPEYQQPTNILRNPLTYYESKKLDLYQVGHCGIYFGLLSFFYTHTKNDFPKKQKMTK